MAENKPIRAVCSEDQQEVLAVTEPVPHWLLFLIASCVTLGSVALISFFMAKNRLDDLDASAKAAEVALGSMSGEITALRDQLKDNVDAEIIFLKILVLNTKVQPALARVMAASIHHHSKVFKRDPDFVLAIIEVESNFNPLAVSSAGAQGLMQVMPHWKDIMGIAGDLKDVDTNVRAGLQVYGFYEEMYRDMGLALAAYNRGPSRVDKDITHRRDPERNGYSDKVEAAYSRLKAMRMNVGL